MTPSTARRALTGFAALTLGSVILAGCAGGFDSPAGVGDTARTSLTAALPTDPSSMDPIRSGRWWCCRSSSTPTISS